jgi:large subunit ribosomal protein L1
MSKHGKKYLAAKAKVNQDTLYDAKTALQLVKDTAYAAFDATVEVHMRTGLDPRQADQQIRDVVLMPHGLGKTVRVLVFAQGDAAVAAKSSGADFVAEDDELITKITGGWTGFDVAIATQDMMGKVGRLGKVLGPRNLMPNPKTGTVVPAGDLPRAIKEAKAGKVEFRLDKTANIHVAIGKVSFKAEQLLDNFTALMEALRKARPAAAKGIFIKKLVVTSTMGPGVKIEPMAVLGEKKE